MISALSISYLVSFSISSFSSRRVASKSPSGTPICLRALLALFACSRALSLSSKKKVASRHEEKSSSRPFVALSIAWFSSQASSLGRKPISAGFLLPGRHPTTIQKFCQSNGMKTSRETSSRIVVTSLWGFVKFPTRTAKGKISLGQGRRRPRR